MSVEDHNKVMFYIDKIIECLDDIAVKVGHPTFEEFTGRKDIR